MYKPVTLLFLGLMFLSFQGSSQTEQKVIAEKKLALIIGNGNYLYSTLANPENDARAMSDALQKLGFTVLLYENLNQVQMKMAIDDFGMKLKNYDVGLFFYAGHGIQSKGFNYLIPVDANLQTEAQVEYDCVQSDRVVAHMEESGARVKIIILDACRNNPFERTWTRSATGRGLAVMNAASGTLIAYATAPGSTASDGSGSNGLYTSAILENLFIPNITIMQMFQNVRNTVSVRSNNQQVPWESTSLIGDFYFNQIEFEKKELKVEAQDLQPEIYNKIDSVLSSRVDSIVKLQTTGEKHNTVLFWGSTRTPFGVKYNFERNFGFYLGARKGTDEFSRLFVSLGFSKSTKGKASIYAGSGMDFSYYEISDYGVNSYWVASKPGVLMEGGCSIHFNKVVVDVGIGTSFINLDYWSNGTMYPDKNELKLYPYLNFGIGFMF